MSSVLVSSSQNKQYSKADQQEFDSITINQYLYNLVFKSKAYLIFSFLLGGFYSLLVFIGMLILNLQFNQKTSSPLQSDTSHYNLLEKILLAICIADIVFKAFLSIKTYNLQEKKMSQVKGISAVIIDCMLLVICILFYIIEVFTISPVIKGFLRIRCFLKLVFPTIRLYTYFQKINNGDKFKIETEIPSEKFNSYSEKIIYILSTIADKLQNPEDLNWCIFVIQNNFLQISNSIQVSSPKNSRRYSKTQRLMNFEESLDTGILNGWVQKLIKNSSNVDNSIRHNNSQSILVQQRRPSKKIDMFKNQEPLAEEIAKFENEINSNNFDCFELHSATKKNSLYFMLQYTYQRFNFQELLYIDASKFVKFSLKLQQSYRDNPYHNSIHAADVIQNAYYYLIEGGGLELLKPNSLDLFGYFLSCAGHDVDHPGHNNIFEQNSRSKLATLYNDQSILEQHHAATFFFLVEEDQCNIFNGIEVGDYSKIRKQIIENILFTDMSKHFGFLAELKVMPTKLDFDPADKNKPELLKALMHASDIGNPGRPFQQCKDLALKILSEFFLQGDKELSLGLPISMLCDRKTTNVAKSQVGFIDFVIAPYFEAIAMILPGMNYVVTQVKHNKEQWAQLTDQYEKNKDDNGNLNI